MTRLPDWRARLAAYVAPLWRTPFQPGQLDCGLFAAGAVEAVTGVDLAGELRGAYATVEDGMRLLAARDGVRDPVEKARQRFPRIPVAQAQVGDLVALALPDGPALGVVCGARVYAVGPEGLVTFDLLDRRVRTAFRV